VTAVFFISLGHIVGQFHYPVPQFMGCGEADTLTWPLGIQCDQYMFALISGCAGTVEIIGPCQHYYLDAMLFQLLSQMGDRIFTDAPIFAELICGSFSVVN